jgi:hypothetical protein
LARGYRGGGGGCGVVCKFRVILFAVKMTVAVFVVGRHNQNRNTGFIHRTGDSFYREA